jgi:hypothetical protein
MFFDVFSIIVGNCNVIREFTGPKNTTFSERCSLGEDAFGGISSRRRLVTSRITYSFSQDIQYAENNFIIFLLRLFSIGVGIAIITWRPSTVRIVLILH